RDLGQDLSDWAVRRTRLAEVHRARTPLAAAQRVHADVGRDAVEPRAQRGASLETVKRAPCAQQRFLHGVLSLERRAEHPVAVRGQLTAMALEIFEGLRGGERGPLHAPHTTTPLARTAPTAMTFGDGDGLYRRAPHASRTARQRIESEEESEMGNVVVTEFI